jgi:hypothetical protein
MTFRHLCRPLLYSAIIVLKLMVELLECDIVESSTTLREQLYRDIMYDIQTSVQAFALLINYCVEAYDGAIRI